MSPVSIPAAGLAALGVLVAAVGVGALGRRAVTVGARSARGPGDIAPGSLGSTTAARFGSWSRLRRRASAAEEHEIEVARLRSSLAGGASVPAAFEALGRTGGPWADGASDVFAQVRAGAPQGEVLDRWAARQGAEAALVVDALAIATATGAAQVAALDAARSTLVERAALAREVRALASQAVASCVVLVATPVAFALVLAVADGRVRRFYLGSWLGIGCLVAGAVLDLAGAWWMSTLVRRTR